METRIMIASTKTQLLLQLKNLPSHYVIAAAA